MRPPELPRALAASAVTVIQCQLRWSPREHGDCTITVWYQAMRAMAKRLSVSRLSIGISRNRSLSPTHVLQLEWPNVTQKSLQRPDKGFRTVYYALCASPV